MSEEANGKDSRLTMAANNRSFRDRSRDKLRRLNRLKRLIFGTFSGLPTLESADITAPHYWLLSSTFIALDAVLTLASGALQGMLIPMIRNAFAPNVLNAIILQLMGSESAEIRERAIYLLIASVSGIDGKLDLKQVSIFERMHGFQCMAEQLSADPDGCTSEIVEALFTLTYWCRSSTAAFKFTSATYTTTSGGFFSHSTSTNRYYSTDQQSISKVIQAPTTTPVRNNADRSATNASANSSVDDNACKEATLIAATAPAMLSILWGSPSNGGRGSVPIVPTSTAMDGSSLGSAEPLGAVGYTSSQMKSSDCGNKEGVQEEEHLSKRGENAVEHSVIDTSDAGAKVDLPRPVSDESSLGPQVDDDQVVLSTVGIIAVPQCLDVLFKVLHNAKSSDQVTRAFHRLEGSVCSHLYSSSRADRLTSNYFSSGDSSKHVRPPHEPPGMKASQQQFSNMESIFAQRDWFVCLCNLLGAFKSHSYSSHVDEHASVLSLSENESVGYGTHHVSNDDPQDVADCSYEDSEDSNSMSNESLGDDLSRAEHATGTNTSHDKVAHQFCAPIYRFICKLITHDMTSSKVGPNRRWNELFRISVPELRDMQETILVDVLEAMQNIAKLCVDMVTVLNLFKNFAMLLDQALEKADLSLLFCVKVIQSLQALTYNCPPEIRPRLKETALLEVRKSYVVRCLLEHHADYYAKVAALHEIGSSLQNYVSLHESKPISDAQVVMIVLGIFVEACEDLEFLLSGIDSNAAPFDCYSVDNAKEGGRCGSPIQTSVNDRLLILLEVLEAIILCIQNCVFSSKECQKCVSKLVTNIVADPLSHLATALLRAFDRSYLYRQRDAGSHHPAIDQPPSSDATCSIPMDGVDDLAVRSLDQSADIDNATSTKVALHGFPSVSYSWWGWPGTSSGDTSAAPVDAIIEVSMEGVPMESSHIDLVPATRDYEPPPEEPRDARSFIRWFCAYEQRYIEEILERHLHTVTFVLPYRTPSNRYHHTREVQSAFRIRVLTEIRSTQRVVDKLREKPMLRFTRFTRLAQEKLTKDRLQGSKMTKEALVAGKLTTGKVVLKFQRDVKVCIASIAEKCEVGRSIFHSALQSLSLEVS